MVLAALRRFPLVVVFGLIAVGYAVYFYFEFTDRLSVARADLAVDLADNPFRGVATSLADAIQIEWGYAVLLAGGVLLIIAPLLRRPSS